MLLDKSRELIVCDHCEYVAQCDLTGPEERSCPHHYELYTGGTEIKTVEVAEEIHKIVKIKTPEKTVIILLNKEDFRILEYAAYQLQISVRKYVKITLKTEINHIRRKYLL